MNLHLLQAVLFSLWMVLMLRLFRRALKAHHAVALKKRRPHTHGKPVHHAEPMAVRLDARL